MSIEQIGYRRLYDAIGCSITGHTEASFDFPLGENLRAAVYMGPKPKLGIWLGRSDKYIAPTLHGVLFEGSYHSDASESAHPRHFFTEVLCSLNVEVAPDLSDAFHRDEPWARDELLALAQTKEKEFSSAADLVAGTLGLRFHRQFVVELINENFFVVRPDATFDHSGVSPAVEVLDDISLTDDGSAQVGHILNAIGQADDELRSNAATILEWLMRAWAEPNPIFKFVALFTPLEIILNGFSVGAEPTALKDARAVRTLIRKHGGSEQKSLLSFLDRLVDQFRPSLNSRFSLMAQEFRIAGWEEDIEAFTKFNSIRNALLHRGESQVKLQVPVGEVDEELRQLEDLVERYVSYSLFGDGVVYSSRWRKSGQRPR